MRAAFSVSHAGLARRVGSELAKLLGRSKSVKRPPRFESIVTMRVVVLPHCKECSCTRVVLFLVLLPSCKVKAVARLHRFVARRLGLAANSAQTHCREPVF